MNPVDENGKLEFSTVDYVETWHAMESCVASGLTRSIGVSNFNSYQLQRILDTCTIKPVTNQVIWMNHNLCNLINFTILGLG